MKPAAPIPYTPPSGEEMRLLVAATGLSQLECARRIGVATRTMRSWCAGDPMRKPPYSAVFALRCLGS
jgi:DNA-binding transcriptional regulator YiaG